MDQRLSEANVLHQRLQDLKREVEKVRPEDADKPGLPGSGIAAFISPFNSLLQQTREFLSHDPSTLKSIAEIEPVHEMEERLAVSYHKKAKFQILVGSGSLLSALRPHLTPGVASIIEEIQASLSELEKILEESESSGDFGLGWQRLERWKNHVSELLRQKVSDKEAEAFETCNTIEPNLDDEIHRCRNFLVALVEALSTNPKTAIRKGMPVSLKTEEQAEAKTAGIRLVSPPNMPDTITLSWLWHNVPVKLWVTLASLMLSAFVAGAYLSGFPAVRQVLRLIPGYPQFIEPKLPSEKAQQLVEKTNDLIAAHSQRLSELQKQLLAEERLAGDHSLVLWQRDTHRAAADKIRELIEKENNNFQRELEALKQWYR